MTKTIDTHALARLVKALDCTSGELTSQEREQFDACFAMDDAEQREAEFERLMQDLLSRIAVGNPVLH